MSIYSNFSNFGGTDHCPQAQNDQAERAQFQFQFDNCSGQVSASISATISISAPPFSCAHAPGAQFVYFGQSLTQQLMTTTAILTAMVNVAQIVQSLTQSIFSAMQPCRPIAPFEVPSSFAAVCPHGGSTPRPAGYGDGDPGTDPGTGYVQDGPSWDSVLPPHLGQGPDGASDEMPHDAPGLQDVMNYVPGSGCPVMDRASAGGNSEVNSAFLRLFEADYSDGTGAMSGEDRPNAREISNTVHASSGDTPSAAGTTDLFWGWGQFLDHDITLRDGMSNEAVNIDVPVGDARFDPNGTGDGHINFNRSVGYTDDSGVRQQHNTVTSMLDGSNVYGSSEERQSELRSFEGGQMLVDARGNLPRNENGFFEAGDGRVNENPVLTSLHTVFVREHNRLADEIAAENPSWSDDQIFEAAKEINVAQMQSITYNEFLPVLLGTDAIPEYCGPRDVDTQITNAFAGAAYRFGHSLVSDELEFVDETGARSELSLDEVFFKPDVINTRGIDDVFRGASGHIAQELDLEVVDSLRNNLMLGGNPVPLDLAALNIQRGRDHGLPSLNDMKRALGQEPLSGFDDPRLRDGAGEKLAEIYDSVEDIDAWVGMLAEEPQGAGMVGETQAAVMVEQFTRTRDGDPNWFAAKFSPEQISDINQTTLADIIERNVMDTDIQDYAMLSDRHQP